MKKLGAFVLLLIGLNVSFLTGYFLMNTILDAGSNDIVNGQPNKPNEASEINENPSDQPASKNTNISVDPIKSKIDKMTLDEKIGQLVIVGIDGYSLDQNSIDLIKDYKVGGVILYNTNVKNSSQLLSLTNSIKETNSNNPVPIFISADQEGGRIDRMPNEIKRFPTNQVIGQKNNSNLSYNIGNSIAYELKAYGFNLNYAPVLDINSNPKNPVIGSRSFGSNAKIVSDLGVQTMNGMQSGGIIPVIKHFPGHGDTSVDSHIGLPVVNKDLSSLKAFELAPFTNAIKSNADAVMAAHILLPKIDPNNPASFSKAIITDLLRNELGFNGVVITDDMTMGAVVKNYRLDNAAIKSINAGSDIILVAHDYNYELKVINALKKAAVDNVITQDRINESVYRILKLKTKYNLNDAAIESVDVDDINQKIDSALK